MKILVVGGGGREHAIIKKIKENKSVTELYALPGNGGIAKDATCVNIGAKEIDKIIQDLKEYNKTMVQVNGYTDSTGSMATNNTLSYFSESKAAR